MDRPRSELDYVDWILHGFTDSGERRLNPSWGQPLMQRIVITS